MVIEERRERRGTYEALDCSFACFSLILVISWAVDDDDDDCAEGAVGWDGFYLMFEVRL